MTADRHRETLRWLQTKPTLKQLCAAHPQQWRQAQAELAAIIAAGRPEDLKRHMEDSARKCAAAVRTLQAGRTAPGRQDGAVAQLIRDRMTQLTIKNHLIGAATGVTTGRLRFNLVNGFLAQRLLFARGLERKPVSLFWFRLVWPLIWQKRRLLPMVETKGIYCFYSRALIEALAALIGPRSCLEIAAGDGTLSRFLAAAGVAITATDDYTWAHTLNYPATVIRQEAGEALAARAPEVVVCSWPPAGNPFERQVFTTPSVELYIVIGSRHQFAAGNWQEYRRQTDFSFAVDENLGRLVLPPELHSAVYLFRRKG